MKLGDLSVAYVELLARAARAEGVDPTAVLEGYQLPASRLALPGNRVSIPRFMRAGHALIEASAAPWLGLRMGSLTGPANLGLAGLIAHSASTLREA
ncbi:AraC family transcriptional regulator ligand-binding domain-containing protein, partial [Gilvimarinus sp. 1_MG-2023]